jgi:hypothetical protein
MRRRSMLHEEEEHAACGGGACCSRSGSMLVRHLVHYSRAWRMRHPYARMLQGSRLSCARRMGEGWHGGEGEDKGRRREKEGREGMEGREQRSERRRRGARGEGLGEVVVSSIRHGSIIHAPARLHHTRTSKAGSIIHAPARLAPSYTHQQGWLHHTRASWRLLFFSPTSGRPHDAHRAGDSDR